ncbi:MAG: ABC transporter permease [Acidobacteriaceae bacterium]|nr:ABC transporter permease [Acidobacteriaceae bacterium]MBV9779258.1 ABC transporter permease [Acidobacteriaceae bacterium]
MGLRHIYNFCRNALYKQRLDQDADEEIRSYIELTAEDKVRCGASREEALLQTKREIGGLEQVKENIRDVRVGASIDRLLQDIRYAFRMLGRNPGFTGVVIAILGLGIGATTAIFSVVDAVMFKPLPFPTADRLIRIQSMLIKSRRGEVASYPDFLDWRARNHAFEGMAVFRTNDFTFAGGRQAERLEGAVVSARLFSLLGVNPSLGRSFLPQDDTPQTTSGTDPVILSYGLWRRAFGSDPSVLGRTIELNRQPFTVIGVMPHEFQFPIQAEPVQLWTTIAVDARGGANAMTAQRGAHYLDVIGLLRPGVRLPQAQAELTSIASALNKEHPENKPRTVLLVPEIQSLAGPIRTPLLVLLASVGCVLLIICANVANLLLVRASRRRKEMTVRVALGASRGRAMRQLLTENIILSLLGGCLGLALAVLLIRLLLGVMPPQVPRLNDVGLDGRLFSFAFLISVASGIVFGLTPALQASRVSLTDSLRESWSSSGNEGKGHTRSRQALVIGEIAIAVVLLLGAGLLLQSFLHLTQVDPGFDPHHVLTFEIDAPPAQEGAGHERFFHDVITRISTIPEVTSISAAASLPLTGDNIASSIEIEGQPTPLGSRPAADFNAVEPGYFRALGITIMRGRDFTLHDSSNSTPVVVVNRALAQRFFPNQNPIGKHIRPGIGNGYGPGEPPMREIVGVIGDVKQSGLNAEAAPEVYAPLAQSPFSPVFIVVRTANDPRRIIDAARRQIAILDKNEPLYHIETLDEYFAQSLFVPRLVTLLLNGFAVVTLILACLGVYGVVSFITLQRTHEIGVRMALGSQRSDVLKMILAEGLRPAVIGLALGITISLKLMTALSSLLFGLRPTDPLTFGAVSVLLTGVALLASYLPAQRAANLDPMRSLRHE